MNTDQLTTTATQHQDAVERFLALYDLYRLMRRERLSVAHAAQINATFEQSSQYDRDPQVRAWARYFHGVIWGTRPPAHKPFLPRQWALLIVEEI